MLFQACNPYQKLLKKGDVNSKYEKAKEYFDKEHYSKAILLFEDILPYVKGTGLAESANYYYAYCHYQLGNYSMAAFYFKSLYDTYPRGIFAEKSLYYFAYCNYLGSPPIELDQTNTRKAIDALQLFINRFPESEMIEDCNTYMDILLAKLEEKAIRIARIYYKIEDYKAAVWSISQVLEDYPLTIHKEELMFMIMQSMYKVADNSVESKKAERFDDFIDYYLSNNHLIAKTKYARQAQLIYETAINRKIKQ
jgi:outer membrane protein assembly factor BamD